MNCWRLKLPLILGLSMVALIALPQSASVASRSCGRAFSGSPDQPGFNVRATNMTCHKARVLTRRYYKNGCKVDDPCNVRGFNCVGHRKSDLYRVRCSRRARKFSFSGGS